MKSEGTHKWSIKDSQFLFSPIFQNRGRYTSVQTFSDQTTKTVQGYKEGATAGEGSKPHKVEKVECSISGSCAGAGSEQFHIYRASRRREMNRIDNMEKEFVAEEESRIFAEKILRNKTECEEKTKKNAEKRKRKKGKQMAAKKTTSGGIGAIVDQEDETSDQEHEIKVSSISVAVK